MAHSDSPFDSHPARPVRSAQERDDRRTDRDAHHVLSGAQECLLHAPGHVVVPVSDMIGSRYEPGVPATARVDDDGTVTVTVDGIAAPYWNHRPDRIAAALAIGGAQATFNTERTLLTVDLPRHRREFFSLTTLHQARTCVHIPASPWRDAGRAVLQARSAAAAPAGSDARRRLRAEPARDARAHLPYRLVMRHPGRAVELHESAQLAPLMRRLEAATRFAPATDARVWSPRGRLITERVNYWAGGRREGSDSWYSLFPPHASLQRVLGELARYRPLGGGEPLAEYRIAVGGYDGRVLGRLSPDEVYAMRPGPGELNLGLPELEERLSMPEDFFAPDIW